MLETLRPKQLAFLAGLRTRFQPFIQIVPVTGSLPVLGFEALGCNDSGGTFVDAIRSAALLGVDEDVVRFALMLDSLRAAQKLRSFAAGYTEGAEFLTITINTDNRMWESAYMAHMLKYAAPCIDNSLAFEIHEAVRYGQAEKILGKAVARHFRFVLDDVNAMDRRTRSALSGRAAMVKVDVKFFSLLRNRFSKQPARLVTRDLYRNRIRNCPLIVEGVESEDDVALLRSNPPADGTLVGGQGLYFELPGPWPEFLSRRGSEHRFGYYLRGDLPTSPSRKANKGANGKSKSAPQGSRKSKRPVAFDSRFLDSLSAQPFGQVDAISTELEKLETMFLPAVPGLMKRVSHIHLVFGAKGSGKTHLLRVLSNHAKNAESVVWLGLHNDPPGTLLVERINGFFGASERPSEWTHLWKHAILFSTFSNIRFNPKLAGRLPSAAYREMAELAKSSGGIDDGMPLARSVYASATYLLNRYDERSTIRIALSHPFWASLASMLERLLTGDVPPLFSFYDGMDEWFEDAPGPWLACQHGMLRAVDQLMDRASSLRGKVHVVVALQDAALWTLKESTHRERILGDTRIVALGWSLETMTELLLKRVKSLDDEYFRGAPGNKGVRDWIGLDHLLNPKRKIREEIEQYLVRHTRMVPRDLVKMGNFLCKALPLLANQDDATTGETVRWLVGRLAAGWAEEQLRICAVHIASKVALDEVRGEAGRGLLESGILIGPFYDELVALLKANTPVEKPYPGSIEALRQRGIEVFGASVDVPNILWQNGVLGYITSDSGRQRFVFAQGGSGALNLPREVRRHVFRACYIDLLALKSNGRVVV